MSYRHAALFYSGIDGFIERTAPFLREGVRRGVGYAVTYKNIGFSEGFDDFSTARVRLSVAGGEATVSVHTAAAEVGQGLVTVQQQIARTELGVERVVVVPADTTVGSAGSTSASRQTYVTGGAVKAACEAVRTFSRCTSAVIASPRLSSAFPPSAITMRIAQSPSVATSSALIVCIRFSASSNTSEAGDSNTSSVTSSASIPNFS